MEENIQSKWPYLRSKTFQPGKLYIWILKYNVLQKNSLKVIWNYLYFNNFFILSREPIVHIAMTAYGDWVAKDSVAIFASFLFIKNVTSWFACLAIQTLLGHHDSRVELEVAQVLAWEIQPPWIGQKEPMVQWNKVFFSFYNHTYCVLITRNVFNW